MALTKTTTNVYVAYNSVPGAGNPNTTTAVNIAGAYHAIACMKLTNLASAPTLPADIRMEVGVNNGTADVWFSYGSGYTNGNAANSVSSWVVDIPLSAKQIRFVAGNNTDNNVTVDCYVEQATAL